MPKRKPKELFHTQRNLFSEWYDQLPEPRPSLRSLGRDLGVDSTLPQKWYDGTRRITGTSAVWNILPFTRDDYFNALSAGGPPSNKAGTREKGAARHHMRRPREAGGVPWSMSEMLEPDESEKDR